MRIIREYYKQLHAKLDNLDEIGKFLETHELQNWLKKKENLNIAITSKDIKSAPKNFLTKRSPGWHDFAGEFYQIFKELTPVLLKLFQIIEQDRTLPNSFHEASIALIPT